MFEEVYGGGGSDGPSGFYRSAGVGPVPLLKLRARYNLPQEFYLETEIDGIYAPISYLNGSDNETVGALLDASLRAGYHVTDTIDAFINVRYLGGGASNTDPTDYNVNWLNRNQARIWYVYRGVFFPRFGGHGVKQSCMKKTGRKETGSEKESLFQRVQGAGGSVAEHQRQAW